MNQSYFQPVMGQKTEVACPKGLIIFLHLFPFFQTGCRPSTEQTKVILHLPKSLLDNHIRRKFIASIWALLDPNTQNCRTLPSLASLDSGFPQRTYFFPLYRLFIPSTMKRIAWFPLNPMIHRSLFRIFSYTTWFSLPDSRNPSTIFLPSLVITDDIIIPSSSK